MSKWMGLIAALASSLLAGGCAFMRADQIHYTLRTPQGEPCQTCDAIAPNSDFIGVALSGGGARASVYGAAGLEALAQAGLMERVTHVSSVSGGGFPAAYFALHKPAPCGADQNTERCISESYALLKDAMRHNFLFDLTVRQILRPDRFSSPTRRLSSLRDALDDQFIGGAQFANLPSSPVLLINGARYDDGRRFVFSNLAIPEQASAFAPFTNDMLRTASFSLPDCARATPPDFSVALAIAVSAGFPPLLGPAAIEATEECDGGEARYWHLGDGGILDNSGVETLEDFALNASAEGAAVKRVVIFSFDAGKSVSTESMMRTRNLKLWTRDPGRVVDIVGKRANAYRDVALGDRYAKSGVEFLVLTMRYSDARLEQWPPSCGAQDTGADAIKAHLEAIPTNFKITECDADLMERAAHEIVRRTLADNHDALEAAGLAPRR